MGCEQVSTCACIFNCSLILIRRRNASLGHGDTDDRTYPEQVVLKHHDESEGDPTARDTIAIKLQPVRVRDVQMSRLHTGTSTSSPPLR
jgi:inhibitor of Bruton tyrosine kinase